MIWMCLVAAISWLQPAAAVERTAVDFGRDVLPILRERCFRCHEGHQPRAGVRLDLRSELLGENGNEPLVVPKKSAESRLLRAVLGSDPDRRMPPEGPRLKPAEIAILARWIDTGLPWDTNLLPERIAAQQHWSFQAVRRPSVPDTSGNWICSPVDAFVMQKHQEQGLAPALEAPRRVLVRRLFLDLCGLPPTWEDGEAFAADQSPDAVERLIDRLLADPRYGEHQARLWLDLARWAESEGFESNHPRPFAWRYRDYVVRSFNRDQPFAEFIVQQIAGDELPEYSDENLIATGFLAATRISSNEEDKALQRNDVAVDIVNAVSNGLLGLTLHCAQCHDHKFDPLTARDYYGLHSFFVRGLPLNIELQSREVQADYDRVGPAELAPAVALQRTLFEQGKAALFAEIREQLSPENRRVYDLPADQRTPAEELRARKISLKFQKSNGEIEKRISPANRKLYDELKKRTNELTAATPPIPQTFAYYSPVTSPHRLQVLPSLGFYPLSYDPVELASLKTYILNRGEVHQLGNEVQPSFPEVLRRTSTNSPRNRLELARWLTQPDQPLVPRVWVNRIWQQHLGRGLVATADDFGLRGARPSHPELLDWLAAEFLAGGGSTKQIQRMIVSSATYQQRALASADSAHRDSDNRWLTRHVPRRLTAEMIRDAWLATSGELNPRVLGPSVPIDQREESTRRSLYLSQRRGQAPDVQRLFDGPQECAASVARRDVSTSPLQSLFLLNSPFAVRQSNVLAARLSKGANDRTELIHRAFRHILLREPSAEELSAAQELWPVLIPGKPAADVSQIPASVCQALLNLNEFIYVE
ncbi:Planctomycete cytochrome C [Anatilimnocola aggregata]|uniref:Planctomycete cytochrome C n=2 Tax=Anatilimnocola aggregata TaxID=2528021 RepID=A0A517YAA4_9BACT|nr:Planctomycete cytochrome C [Anatilimnocola aggregata]